jgi:hypothetical protein
MLDAFLKVAAEHEEKRAHSLELTKKLEQLPEGELHHIVNTGEVKLASEGNWIEQFKGTEHYDRALELEAEFLKTASLQSRVDQRLLELKKEAMAPGLMAELQKGAPMGKKIPMNMNKANAISTANEINKSMPKRSPKYTIEKDPFSKAAGATKEALSNALIDKAVVNTVAAGKMTPQRAQHAADLGKRVASKGSNMIGNFSDNKPVPPAALPMVRQGAHLQNLASKLAWAEDVGRGLAQNDKEKVANAALLKSLAPHAGTIIGGGLGVLHGLTKKDGGIGDAIAEGGVGAAAGYGAQHALKTPTGEKLKARALQAVGKGNSPAQEASDLAKFSSAFEDELQKIAEQDKEAFGALLAGAARAIPGLVSKAAPTVGKWLSQPGNLMKGGIFAAQTIGSGIQNKQQGGSFLGGAATGALSGAGTLAG